MLLEEPRSRRRPAPSPAPHHLARSLASYLTLTIPLVALIASFAIAANCEYQHICCPSIEWPFPLKPLGSF